MESTLNMPVVNMAMYGGSPAFLEEVGKLNIGEGDILILCHSDYNGGDGIDAEQMWITIENHTDLWRIVRAKDIIPMLKALPNYILSATYLWATDTGNKGVESAYSREHFNKYGDNIYPREESKMTFYEGRIVVPSVNLSTAKRINELNEFCNQKGATLLIAGYPIAYGEYTPEKNEYVDFQKELEDMVECEIISDFTDYFYEYELFYDTHLHLTEEGVSLRTEQLITDLTNWREKQ